MLTFSVYLIAILFYSIFDYFPILGIVLISIIDCGMVLCSTMKVTEKILNMNIGLRMEFSLVIALLKGSYLTIFTSDFLWVSTAGFICE